MNDIELGVYLTKIIRELEGIREALSNIYKSQNRDPVQDLVDAFTRQKESEETSRSIFDGPRKNRTAPPK